MKKGDTVKASVPVNSPFTLEELVHFIDVSVNTKYGTDLEGITRMLMDSVKGLVESLRQESEKFLGRLGLWCSKCWTNPGENVM
jgi:hypothetical protein